MASRSAIRSASTPLPFPLHLSFLLLLLLFPPSLTNRSTEVAALFWEAAREGLKLVVTTAGAIFDVCVCVCVCVCVRASARVWKAKEGNLLTG